MSDFACERSLQGAMPVHDHLISICAKGASVPSELEQSVQGILLTFVGLMGRIVSEARNRPSGIRTQNADRNGREFWQGVKGCAGVSARQRRGRATDVAWGVPGQSLRGIRSSVGLKMERYYLYVCGHMSTFMSLWMAHTELGELWSVWSCVPLMCFGFTLDFGRFADFPSQF